MQANPITPKDIRHLIVFGVLFATVLHLLITFIGAILGIVILFSLVTLIVLVLNPGVGWLEKHKVPRPVSAGIIAVVVIAAIGAVMWLMVPTATRETKELFRFLPGYMAETQKWLVAKGEAVGLNIKSMNLSQAVEMLYTRTGPILSRIGTYTLSAVTLIVSGFVVFISVIYMLASPRPIVEGALRLLRPEQSERVTTVVQRIALQMRQWSLAMAAGMTAIFLLTYILLGLILHVPFAFLFSVLAGLLEIVPTVGPILSAIPPIVIVLADDPTKAIWVAVGFIIIQQIENNLIIPLILGGGMKLHPVSVIFAVLVMGGMFGILGIFLAVPALAALKIVVEEFYLIPKEAAQKHDVADKVERIVSG